MGHRNISDEEKHRIRHQELHRALDELVADWISSTGKTVLNRTVGELAEWSHKQSQKPDHPYKGR